MKISIAIIATCALALAQADIVLAGNSVDSKTDTLTKIAVHSSAEPSIEVALDATVNQSGATVAAEAVNRQKTTPDIPKPINGARGTGGGRYTFKTKIAGQTPANEGVNVESSNRDHIDQDAQTDLKK